MLSRGVIVFFVISGFLLYCRLVAARAGDRPRPNILRYARRRVLVLTLAVTVALAAVSYYLVELPFLRPKEG